MSGDSGVARLQKDSLSGPYRVVERDDFDFPGLIVDLTQHILVEIIVVSLAWKLSLLPALL